MALNTGFQGLPVAEVVPEAIAGMSEGMTKTSLLVSRRRVRFQPQTGLTATPGSIVQFVLADSSSLLDVNSATISFRITATGTNTAAAPCALDDGVPMRRLQISLNGNLVEDIDNAHRLANLEIYASADKSWYAQQPTAGLSSRAFPSVSCFGNYGTNSWQVRVGSYYAPSQPATSAPRMFSLLQTAYGEAVNEKPGLINRNMYSITTATDGTVAGAPTAGAQRIRCNDAFIVGYNFDNFKNTGGTNLLDADGLSVLSQAGSQVVVQVAPQTNIPASGITPIVSLHATRYLSLMNGTLRIVGT